MSKFGIGEIVQVWTDGDRLGLVVGVGPCEPLSEDRPDPVSIDEGEYAVLILRVPFPGSNVGPWHPMLVTSEAEQMLEKRS